MTKNSDLFGLTSLEMCAGAGGQAIGLEEAGFEHIALVENDQHCCNTLTENRPHWNVHNSDLNDFSAEKFRGIDLLSGGLPCPPFSIAGKQLGASDERNLFPAALRIVDETRPKAILIENVRGFLGANNWNGLAKWMRTANKIAPTLVGGSKKHGGPDLGPTRAKKAWKELGVNGMSIAEEAPERSFKGDPRLTVRMCARLQGFPDDWTITGRKTAAYRQVGNAFPAPFAYAVGQRLAKAITSANSAVSVRAA